ncbi:hypothetical protein S7711_05067 [Stachybotrys chartarum IBT 7711]|uniref:HotDog ACOT-type domain-containing protein n=1 Tax=Stachybotrys chartarum (strain CBS 109288 / IBT 7711) TaxID=1280523 RepID=A0A084BAQ9_STACB|nr:hypothetical protein S7711_05067 [Stachybotrys chartarum IBT 7711]
MAGPPAPPGYTPPDESNPQARPDQRDPWTQEQNPHVWDDVPSGGGQGHYENASFNAQDVPSALRPGGGFAPPNNDGNIWDDQDQPPPPPLNRRPVPDASRMGVSRKETNPFLRKKIPEPSNEPVATEAFANLSMSDRYTTTPPTAEPINQPPPKIVLEDFDEDPWRKTPQPAPQSTSSNSPNLINFAPADEPAWDEVSQVSDSSQMGTGPNRTHPAPPVSSISGDLREEQGVWDDLGAPDSGRGKAPQIEAEDVDDWNLIDADPSDAPSAHPAAPVQAQPTVPPKDGQVSTDEPSQPGPSTSAHPATSPAEEQKPELPPRDVGETPRWVPSREPVDGSSETYQVKNIEWFDSSSAQNPRVSPILVQNANGPCPLVALVNALTMTTPTDIPDTALVQVLRSREQVSLNLLLDAVFDELMSSRRTGSEDALPDVSDLYAFLLSLHTGMNVNPRFIPTPQMINAYKRTSLTHLHPAERGDLIPGTFENTHEMSLYAAFSIPLIHGWLPPRSDPVYEALERQASSYEDAQNLLFRQEELEDKLFSEGPGLTEAEQELYQDIITIKGFLESSATQLTPWGIEVIGKAIRPGTFAILFRNDHFSTLYCHPQTMQLLTLVTDAGYRTHEEVVWESLVDVNGEHTEFFSGSFRMVGTGGTVGGPSDGGPSDGGGEWTTVQGRHGKGTHQVDEEALTSPTREQEDRDLALALQLQEEEDERHRAAEARRRRESLLSEQYIEQQGRQPAPAITTANTPNRGGRRGSAISTATRRTSASGNNDLAGRRTSSNAVSPVTTGTSIPEVRPLVPPRRPNATAPRPVQTGEEAPPPYEQASASPLFEPPMGHPAHASSEALASQQSSQQGSSAGSATAGRTRIPGQPLGGRRPGGYPGNMAGSNNNGNNGQTRQRDCVVIAMLDPRQCASSEYVRQTPKMASKSKCVRSLLAPGCRARPCAQRGPILALNARAQGFHGAAARQTDGVFRGLSDDRLPTPWIEAWRQQQQGKGTRASEAQPQERDLSPRKMSDSYHRVVLPLGQDPWLSDTYINSSGHIRLGTIFMDLDALSGIIVYKHSGPGVTVVTAALDRITIAHPLTEICDLEYSGQVTYASGRSSAEITCKVARARPEGEPSKPEDVLLTCTFTMVALDPVTKKPANMPALTRETPEEEEAFQAGEAKSQAKKKLAKQSLLETEPNDPESALIHKMWLRQVQYRDPHQPLRQPDNVIPMADTRVSTASIMQPQYRNRHQTMIFGGFHLKQTFELAFCCAASFAHARPTFISADPCTFRNPVPVGSVLYLRATVAYTDPPLLEEDGSEPRQADPDNPVTRVHVRVDSKVRDVEHGVAKPTGQFNYTFSVPKSVRVIPHTYHEYMMYIDARRRVRLGDMQHRQDKAGSAGDKRRVAEDTNLTE